MDHRFSSPNRREPEEIQMVNFSYRERMVIEGHERLSPRLIYEIIRRNGIEELNRPARSLVFSGIIAGVVITFSFVCKAFFATYLPNEHWAPLITNIGYSVGFLIVILGHMQLFTENTITTVVPMLNPITIKKVWNVAKLWFIVLGSNLIGTTLAAVFLTNHEVFNPEFVVEMDKIAKHVAHFTASENMWRGIPSGILIAAIVWMMPIAKNFAFSLVLFFTYLIALGDFTHVVVGSAEMCYWVLKDGATLYDYFIRFLFPTCLGNIIGGTGVFTLLIYIQVFEEIKMKK